MKIQTSFLGLFGLILMASSLAEGVFKWEDENGQMHYSDMPREGATEIEIAPAQTFTAPSLTGSKAPRDGKAATDDAATMKYESISITSPSNEETIWNTGGTVSVKMSVKPILMTGHKVRLYLDGQSLADLPDGTSVQLSDVVRGGHTLRAEILDPTTGMVQIKSAPVKFYIKQQTADNGLRAVPTNPNLNTKPQRSQKNKPRPTPRN